MKFKNIGQWKDSFEHDGLLFFSQRIEEMLFYYTSHLYKVPVNNSIYLIWEYLHTSKLVEEKVINENHLKYILDEFIDTFQNDIVIKNSISNEKMQYILQRLQSASNQDQTRIMHYLFHYFSDYSEWCKDYIRKIVKQEKEKKKIERALRCYLPMLLNGGYSQEFIYNYNNKIFGDKKISDTSQIDAFLNRFDFADRKYIVYIGLSKKAKQFEDILNTRLHVNFATDKFSSKLKLDQEEYIYASFEVQALDENRAAQQVYDTISLFIRFYKFLGNRRDEWFYSKCAVRDDEDNCVVVELKPRGYSYSEDYDDRTIGQYSEVLITSLVSNAHKSFYLINKVLEIHNMAIENPDMKNAFLNLWSILEIVGVDKRDDSKIKEIEKAIIPILQMDFAISIFEELHDYIKANIPEENYYRILAEIDKDIDENKKIACLVILDDYEDLRKKMNLELKKYPLIRSRISQTNEMFKKKKHFSDELDRYTQRVEWHLLRMYRTRNAIIHSGESIDSLKSIGEHLHSYIDCILSEIMLQLSRDGYCTIDNVLINAGFISDDIKKCFSVKEKVSYKDVLKLWNEEIGVID